MGLTRQVIRIKWRHSTGCERSKRRWVVNTNDGLSVQVSFKIFASRQLCWCVRCLLVVATIDDIHSESLSLRYCTFPVHLQEDLYVRPIVCLTQKVRQSNHVLSWDLWLVAFGSVERSQAQRRDRACVAGLGDGNISGIWGSSNGVDGGEIFR